MNNLDNAYSGIINIMREQGIKYNAPSLMLGEVINSEPILIKVGDIQLDKDNLYIADYLMSSYCRSASFSGSMSFSSSNVSGSTDSSTYEHNHNITSHTHTVEAHSHTATVDGKTGTTDSAGGGRTGGSSLSTDSKTNTHNHNLTSLSVNANNLSAEGELELVHSGLMAGDKVAIQQLQGTNKFIVFCRLI